MFIESQCLLASEEPGGKFIPLLSTVSVLPTHSSQNFCTNKHFILSIDPKHTLKWLAEEELPYLSYIQYLPYQKGKSLVCGNDRGKGQVTTSPTVQQIPVTPSFPVQSGLSNPPSMRMPKLSCCLDEATGTSQGSPVQGRGHPLTCATHEQLLSVPLMATLCDQLVQSHHLWHGKDP